MNKLDTCAIHSKEQCSCLAYLIVLGCRDLEMEEELEKEEKEQGHCEHVESFQLAYDGMSLLFS